MDLYIASMMLCDRPRSIGTRTILSCSDSVWEPVRNVPADLHKYLTDELGNETIDYGGFLFLKDHRLIDCLEEKNLFACFRGIHSKDLEIVQCPLAKEISAMEIPLTIMGWDIANGNGWVSASTDGVYPIDPFNGSVLDENVEKINAYGLFDSLDDCKGYCLLNNQQVPARAPWYPVAIFLDHLSLERLTSIS